MIVEETWFTLGSRLFVRDSDIFTVDGFIVVEGGLRLNTLREWFILQFALVVNSFFFSELSRTVIIILHVWNLATESGLFTILAFFWWVGQEVSGLSDYSTFFVTVLFLNIGSFILMFISRLNWFLNLLGRFEFSFVACLQVAIFSSGSSQYI